jgi:hypothetical protein
MIDQAVPEPAGLDEIAIEAVSGPEDVKQPEWLKLLQILGPGLITGASDDDPQRDRHLFPGRRAVRLRPRLGAPAVLAPDVCDPAD